MSFSMIKICVWTVSFRVVISVISVEERVIIAEVMLIERERILLLVLEIDISETKDSAAVLYSVKVIDVPEVNVISFLMLTTMTSSLEMIS